jgi:hypothetical protein
VPPVQSPFVAHAVKSFVQRRQSAFVVHAEPSSVQMLLATHGSAAVFDVVPVVTCWKRTAKPWPEMLSVTSGGQLLDTPPNSGLTASTVHGSPSFGPPSHANVSPTSGFWLSAPQRGHGLSFVMPRWTRERRNADASPSPV